MLKSDYLSAMAKYLNKEHAYNESIFVKKVTGKGLSTNDYSAAEQTKLAGIAAGAEANVIDTITVNNTAISPDANKNINIDMTSYALSTDLSSVYKYKGSLSSYALLPSTDNEVGDVYNVEAADATNGINAGDNVAWNGTAWDVLAGTVDLSGYVQAEAGKGLSHIDVTQSMKDAWDNIDVNDDVLDSDFNFLFPPVSLGPVTNSKYKTYLVVEDGILKDLTNNVTWNNTASIATGAGVYGGDCLYFDNSQTETVDGQTNYIVDDLLYADLPVNLINTAAPQWTISYWFKLSDLNYTISQGKAGGYGPLTQILYDNSSRPMVNFMLSKKDNLNITNEISSLINIHYPIMMQGDYASKTLFNIPVYNINTWFHLAIVRNNNNISVYINGTKYVNESLNLPNEDNTVFATEIKITDSISQSTLDSTPHWYKTYFDEFIFIEDALWTDTFTPPQDYICRSL